MPTGLCHLCGIDGPLSYEHVPPQAAFNDHRVLEANIYRLMGADKIDDLRNPKGKYNQRGAGKHTLCERCNNDTGSWYGAEYVRFAQLMYPQCWMSPDAILNTQVSIHPLRVFKQVLVMFCSANSPRFAQARPDMVRFLLNRHSRDYKEDLRLFMALFDLSQTNIVSRQSGMSGRLSPAGTHVYSEISFPPFNLVLSASGGSPDPNLFEITWFKNFEYKDSVPINLTLRNLAVATMFPADYRTFSDVEKESSRTDDAET